MEKKLTKTILAILLWPVCAYSTDITFTSSGTITDGNAFGNVYVQNNGTVVDMSGGQITQWLNTYDTSVLNMSGGQLTGNIFIHNSSIFNVSGGTIAVPLDFVVYGSANLSGGNITANRLKTSPAFSNPLVPASVININGGNLNFDKFDIEGVVNIYRGLLYVDEARISTVYLPTINIYGYGFNYNPGTEILTGCLLDKHPFTIKGVDTSEYARFNLIPEPMSLLFFGFGLLSVRLRRIN
jgi:hypothetical protein